MTPTPAWQSAANQAAWWAHHGYVPPEPICIETDRCYYVATDQILTVVADLADRGILVETARPTNHGADVLRGYREAVGKCSAQVIVHPDMIEMDFDEHNPRDLVDGIGHAVEVLRNKFGRRKTDPFKIAQELRKRGIHGDVSG